MLTGLGKAVHFLTAQFELCRNGRVGGLAARAAVLSLAALAAAGCMHRSGDTAEISVDLTAPPAAVLSDQTASPASAVDQPLAAIKTAEASRKDLRLPPHLRQDAQGQTGLSSDAVAGKTGADPAQTGSPGGKAKTQQARAPSRPIRLADAVASAVLSYPEIRIHEAKAREAKAGIAIAQSALYPNADLRLATGGNFTGSYQGQTIPYREAANTLDGRFDGGLILRQLVYDFGAARSDIERAELLRDTERLKLKDKIDDIAYRTTQSYLKVMEHRSLLKLVDEIIGAHEELALIVQAHAQEGHGTLADVQRVSSRLVDVRAIRSDVSLQLKAAEDQFERLTRQSPSRLVAPPDLRRSLPASPVAAISEMLSRNPRLAALQTNTQSTRKELEFQRASILPKINLELETESKNFRNGPQGRTQAEARAMLSMRYRLMDGGLAAATEQQILARIEGGEFSYLNEREQLEADIRQAYRAIDSAGRKLKLVADGVSSAVKVRELYLEQFKGGKRTVFELLDSQMSFYSIRRSQIENQYEGQRAMFDILRATGSLTAVLSRRN